MSWRGSMPRRLTALLIAALAIALAPGIVAAPVYAKSGEPVKQPVAIGTGGAFASDVFIDPATGKPVPFPELVTSGLGVGVPGTLQAWKVAAEKFGTRPFASLLKPAIQIADEGFVVNPTFNLQINQNLSRFQD